MAWAAPSAQALAPAVEGTWPSAVSSSGATLRAEVNPGGLTSSYRFEYTTEADYLAKGFAASIKSPPSGEIGVSAGVTTVEVNRAIGGLQPGTSYRFRIVVTNGSGSTPGPTRILATGQPSQPLVLADGRGWEMVSPIDKNGGEIQGFRGVFGGGVLQAAAGGGAITYTSSYSFANAQGSPGASQYISRLAPLSWNTENITPPSLSGTYPESPTSGVPYQLFSPDLADALLNNGRRCRTSVSSQCPVENAPLAESAAPAGYRNYYRRHNPTGSFQALLTSADLATLALGPEDFELAYAGATPNLQHVVLSTCAALTGEATEVPGTEGECDPSKQNLYEKTGSAPPRLINLKVAASTGTPGAALASQSRAISDDGSRVYWTLGPELFVRDGNATLALSGGLPAGHPEFQTASSNGSVAFFTEEGHLFRYELGGAATDLTPAGGVLGVLGASDKGDYVYYTSSAGLFLWHSGVTTAQIAPQVAPGNYEPSTGTGTARVSADGRHLAFVSAATGLADYDNRNLKTGTAEAEVYLYTAPPGAGAGGLACASCRPNGERPLAAASLTGASFNGTGFNLAHSYKPRALSDAANRLFFNSFDQLAPQDSNGDADVYQWEAPGSGSCAKPSGCVSLISSGRAEGGATFVDASADGSDAFFLTDGSLVLSDPGAVDLYDARVGGGFPQPESRIPCFGDACQPLPLEPEDPTPGTLRDGRGNPPAPKPSKAKKCKKGKVKKHGKCVKKKHSKRKVGK
ncbi:MAG TPA: hypothetical protein VGO36_06570 [Solirubrobacterales bacterium]|nr:hypothetical protein [Solirubrobacterales bacterium]